MQQVEAGKPAQRLRQLDDRRVGDGGWSLPQIEGIGNRSWRIGQDAGAILGYHRAAGNDRHFFMQPRLADQMSLIAEAIRIAQRLLDARCLDGP